MPGRPPTQIRRQPIDARRWRTRIGAPWRDVPEHSGPWGRVYYLFCRRQRYGTWTAASRNSGPRLRRRA
ncbi:transposase [Streptomyces sp. NPDC101194]|uniref:transposase n=1 Tax=Streptomyces sp. NPDC101194 TaxID=3366127 RepID=UPI00380B67B6